MQATSPDVRLRSRRRALAVVVTGSAVLLALGAGVLTGLAPQLRVDAAVSTALYAGDDRSAGLDALLETLTAPGTTWFRALVLLPVALWLALRRRWRTVLWVVVAAALVGPLTTGVKELVGRARPALAGGGLEYGGLSYPSGHSSGVATLVTVVLVLAWPRLRAAARTAAVVTGAALVVLVALTRLWLGVHFLSDVVGGVALGVAWSLGVALLLGGLPGEAGALPGRAETECTERDREKGVR